MFGTYAATTLATTTAFTTAFATSLGTTKTTVTPGAVTVYETLATTTLATATSVSTNTVIYERVTGTGATTEVLSGSDYNTSYWDGSQWTE